MSFPDGFSVLAVCGYTRVRKVENSLAGALAWSARMTDAGWACDEPVPWDGVLDNVVALDERRPETKGA